MVTRSVSLQVIVLVDQYRSATGANKIALPTNDSDLEEKWAMIIPFSFCVIVLLLCCRLDTEQEMIMKTYDETQVLTSHTDCSIRVSVCIWSRVSTTGDLLIVI